MAASLRLRPRSIPGASGGASSPGFPGGPLGRPRSARRRFPALGLASPPPRTSHRDRWRAPRPLACAPSTQELSRGLAAASRRLAGAMRRAASARDTSSSSASTGRGAGGRWCAGPEVSATNPSAGARGSLAVSSGVTPPVPDSALPSGPVAGAPGPARRGPGRFDGAASPRRRGHRAGPLAGDSASYPAMLSAVIAFAGPDAATSAGGAVESWGRSVPRAAPSPRGARCCARAADVGKFRSSCRGGARKHASADFPMARLPERPLGVPEPLRMRCCRGGLFADSTRQGALFARRELLAGGPVTLHGLCPLRGARSPARDRSGSGGARRAGGSCSLSRWMSLSRVQARGGVRPDRPLVPRSQRAPRMGPTPGTRRTTSG